LYRECRYLRYQAVAASVTMLLNLLESGMVAVALNEDKVTHKRVADWDVPLGPYPELTRHNVVSWGGAAQ
jgi:hypothetical protein